MKKLLIILIVMLVPISLYGEPTPTVHYLMNEPASVFDLGMLRLELYFKKLSFLALNEKDLGVIHVPPEYDWDSNKISLKIIAVSRSNDNVKLLCKKLTNEVKRFFYIQENGLATFPGSLFTHDGYKSKKRPENLAEQINNIILINVDCYYRGDKMGEDSISAKSQSNLLSKDIYFLE